jgi:predicted MFS family arabinose efflux permease
MKEKMAERYSPAYQRYVTLLLLLVYIFNQTDRAVFWFLMEPIKHDLALSDRQLGFLAGPALTVLYATLGVPIARRADRGYRVVVISISIALWSVMAMLSGAVSTFWQLALTRVGVGVGEAGFTAIAQSLIGDYHAPAERTRAIAIFMLGWPLAGPVSSLIGGWVSQLYGWRATFIVAGLPGIGLALLVRQSIREPHRDHRSVPPATPLPIRQVWALLWRRRTLRYLTLAMMLMNPVVAAIISWLPAFFIRVHGLSTGALGIWLAVLAGLGGGTGIWLGSYLTSRFGAHDARVRTGILAGSGTLVTLILLLALLWPTQVGALLWMLPGYGLMFSFYAPVSALVQELTPPRIRATMLALTILAQVLLAGFSIWTLGILSDFLIPVLGHESLRGAMVALSLVALGSALHFWRAGRFIRADLAAAGTDPCLNPAI